MFKRIRNILTKGDKPAALPPPQALTIAERQTETPAANPTSETRRSAALAPEASFAPFRTNKSLESLATAEALADCGHMSQWCAAAHATMTRAGHLRSVVEQRMASLAREIGVAAATETPEAARVRDFVVNELRRVGETNWRATLIHTALAQLFGYSATEIAYEDRTGPWPIGWRQFYPIRHVHFDVAVPGSIEVAGATDYELLLRTEDGDRERLDPGMWFVLDGSAFMTPNQSGLLRPALKYALVELRALGNWVLWDDRNGVPFPVVQLASKHPTRDQQIQARRLVENFGNDGGAVLYGEAVVTLMESIARGPQDGHTKLIEAMQQILSKLLLGGTLTNDRIGPGGTQAQATVHRLNTTVLVMAHAVQIVTGVTDNLFGTLLDYNGIDRALCPKLHIEVLPDLGPDVLMLIAQQLSQMGVPLSVAQLRQITGFREPESPTDAVRVFTPSGGTTE